MLEFDIHGFWHVGTGRGAGANADAVVLRDEVGLPFVPGKQVKGLLREAVELAENCKKGISKGRAKRWFGSSIEDALPGQSFTPDTREASMEAMRFATNPGELFVGSAVLGKGRPAAERWRAWAKDNGPLVAEMFRAFASTKIEADGIVAEGALRSIEVVVPMKLYAELRGPANGQWMTEILPALSLIDGVGGHRSRGFGRVTAREVAP